MDVTALKREAEIARQNGDLQRAQSLLAECVRIAPGDAPARYNYASVLVSLSRFAAAKAQIEELLRLDLRNLDYRSLMAVILGHLGEYADAFRYHEDVLKDAPDESKTWAVYANDLRAAGRRQDCIDTYRKILERDPGYAAAYWYLANLKTFLFSQAELDAMRRQLARPDLTLRNRVFLHFSLGKAIEDAGTYADAFEHFKMGNALHRSSIDYEPNRTTMEFRRMKQMFTPEFFAGRGNCGCVANDPVFIVGLPRSGSTLVEQILSSHSAIVGTRELPNVQAIAGRLKGRFPDSLPDLGAEAFRAMGETYVEETRVFRKSQRPFFTDKMPSNFAYSGFIALILPNARIIDVRRHPLDCCLANFKQIFSRGYNFSYSLGDAGRYYADYVDLMSHFDEVLPGKVHRLVYEQLVADPETEIRRLLDYVGVPFEPDCLRFHANERAVRSASSEQVRKPIFAGAVGSWRMYEPWIGRLKQALGPLLDASPGPC